MFEVWLSLGTSFSVNRLVDKTGRYWFRINEVNYDRLLILLSDLNLTENPYFIVRIIKPGDQIEE